MSYCLNKVRSKYRRENVKKKSISVEYIYVISALKFFLDFENKQDKIGQKIINVLRISPS